MSEQLLSCPFCGAIAELEDCRTIFVVRCLGCTACVLGDRAPEPQFEMPLEYWAHFAQTAVDAWNRRAPRSKE